MLGLRLSYGAGDRKGAPGSSGFSRDVQNFHLESFSVGRGRCQIEPADSKIFSLIESQTSSMTSFVPFSLSVLTQFFCSLEVLLSSPPQFHRPLS